MTYQVGAQTRNTTRRSLQASLCLLPLMALALTACGEKADLDRRMNELCKRDGAVKIYEVVRLTPQMFDQNNNVRQTSVQKKGGNETLIADAYIETFQLTVLKDGDPLKGQGLLHRQHKKILRIADDKVLAESVQYIRAGGDGFHLGHHTTSVCPRIDGGLVPRVFSKQ